MILVNTDYISGKELDMLGLVKGSTIQTKNIGRDITQSFKTLVGGELKAYKRMMSEARALATKRMVEEAEALALMQLLTSAMLPLRLCREPQKSLHMARRCVFGKPNKEDTNGI